MENKIIMKTDPIIDYSIGISKWAIKEIIEGEEIIKNIFFISTSIQEISADNLIFKLKGKNLKKYVAVEINSYFSEAEPVEDIGHIKGLILFEKELRLGMFYLLNIIYFNTEVKHKKVHGFDWISYDSRITQEEDKNNILYKRSKSFKVFENNFLKKTQVNQKFY